MKVFVVHTDEYLECYFSQMENEEHVYDIEHHFRSFECDYHTRVLPAIPDFISEMDNKIFIFHPQIYPTDAAFTKLKNIFSDTNKNYFLIFRNYFWYDYMMKNNVTLPNLILPIYETNFFLTISNFPSIRSLQQFVNIYGPLINKNNVSILFTGRYCHDQGEYPFNFIKDFVKEFPNGNFFFSNFLQSMNLLTREITCQNPHLENAKHCFIAERI